MNKIKMTNKLSLNKETISKLNDGQMQHVRGGFTFGLSLGALCCWSNDQGFGKDNCKARYTKKPWCDVTPPGSGTPIIIGNEDPIIGDADESANGMC